MAELSDTVYFKQNKLMLVIKEHVKYYQEYEIVAVMLPNITKYSENNECWCLTFSNW